MFIPLSINNYSRQSFREEIYFRHGAIRYNNRKTNIIPIIVNLVICKSNHQPIRIIRLPLQIIHILCFPHIYINRWKYRRIVFNSITTHTAQIIWYSVIIVSKFALIVLYLHTYCSITLKFSIDSIHSLLTESSFTL